MPKAAKTQQPAITLLATTLGLACCVMLFAVGCSGPTVEEAIGEATEDLRDVTLILGLEVVEIESSRPTVGGETNLANAPWGLVDVTAVPNGLDSVADMAEICDRLAKHDYRRASGSCAMDSKGALFASSSGDGVRVRLDGVGEFRFSASINGLNERVQAETLRN